MLMRGRRGIVGSRGEIAYITHDIIYNIMADGPLQHSNYDNEPPIKA